MFMLEEHLDFFFALCEPYYIAKTLGATGMQNVLFPVSNSQKRTTAKNIRALASPLELLCDFSWNRPHKRLRQADGAVMPAQFKSCVACCEVMRLTKGSYALGSGKILILDVKHLNTHKKLRQQGRDQHTNRERSDFAHLVRNEDFCRPKPNTCAIKCEMFASTSRAANLFYLEAISSWQVSLLVFHSGWWERLEDRLWKPASYLPDAVLKHEYDSSLLQWIDLQQQLWLCSLICSIGWTDK